MVRASLVILFLFSSVWVSTTSNFRALLEMRDLFILFDLTSSLLFFYFVVSIDNSHAEREQVNPNVVKTKCSAGRTRFSIYQRAELEAAFTASPYLSTQRRLSLAARLRVTPVAVQVTKHPL